MQLSGYLSVPGNPYPSFPGVGVGIGLLDLIRIEAGVSLIKNMFIELADAFDDEVELKAYSYNATVRLRVPFLETSPVFSVGYSKTVIDGEGSSLLGNRRSEKEFITPAIGVEHRFHTGGGPKAYFGVELFMEVTKETDGQYRDSTHELTFLGIEGTEFDSPVLPNVYFGVVW